MIPVLVFIAVGTCIYAYPSKCSKIFVQIFDQIRNHFGVSQHAETKLLEQDCIESLSSKIVPLDVDKGIKDKLKCLKKMNPDRNSATLSLFWGLKKYLEIVCSIPWGVFTKDNLNVEDVRSKLDKSIFG